MSLQIYNSLSKQLEVFHPADLQKVKMYVCGPTVYDRPHIGNARSTVVYDVLYRLLMNLYGSDKVLYVRNITDVDDKIIDAALKNHIKIQELTEKIHIQFSEDMSYLNCLKPNMEPKATEHISDMVSMIEKLISEGVAYVAENHVYFDVSKYDQYTKLSGRSLDELESGYRIEVNSAKHNPADFVLWKPAKDEDDASAKFESPWGVGRPGWHVECSAMSTKYLGHDFDIHGGGVDLIFPHHTNEIAQSCCAYPGSQYAKYWVHNGFLTVEGEKMSKSLGNFITVHDLENEDISGEAIRYFLLSSHYRKPLNWTKKGLHDAEQSISYFTRILDKAEINQERIDSEIISALKEDLNTPKAFARLHEIAKEYHKTDKEEQKRNLAEKLLGSGRLLGLFFEDKKVKKDIPQEIKDLIAKRQQAKKDKDWNLADQIRDQLQKQGIILEDKPGGETSWKYAK